jgi:cathepsin B
VLSPEYMISCDEGNMGCNGGYLNKSWDFLERTGVPVDSCFEYLQVEGECPVNSCPDGG